MDAREFMQGHADGAVAGKIPEILKDLTPEAMTQLGPLMAGAPQPVRLEQGGAGGAGRRRLLLRRHVLRRRRQVDLDARDRAPDRRRLEDRRARQAVAPWAF